MSYSELVKKVQDSIRSVNCTNKFCFSGGKDTLQIVWFGKIIEEKKITCSSCFVMNNEAVQKSLPTTQNVMPVTPFIAKFGAQLQNYEETKSQPKWLPTELKERLKLHTAEVQNFDLKLSGTLKQLATSLQNFTKKVVECNRQIYNHETFNEIIELYSNNQMNKSLQKIHVLIAFLNKPDKNYRFQDVELRQKKIMKLNTRIAEISTKVVKVLEELLVQIQQKNSVIVKI